MSVKEQRVQQILRELMQGMTPSVRIHVNAGHLLFDTLPMLLQILVPTLRPVSVETDYCYVMDENGQNSKLRTLIYAGCVLLWEG
jgi:hypothetical protein